MYYGYYGISSGNIDRSKDYDLKNLDTTRIAAQPDAEKVDKPLFNFSRNVDASSADAMGVYGKASFNIGQPKLAFAKGLNVSSNDAALIGRYVTPEQQARVSDNMLRYFG